MDDEGGLVQRKRGLSCTQRSEAEAAPVVDDHDVRWIVAQRIEDLQRWRQIGRPNALIAFENPDVDVRGLVAPYPLRAEGPDFAAACNQETDVVSMPCESDREERVGRSGAPCAGPAEQLAGDDCDLALHYRRRRSL